MKCKISTKRTTWNLKLSPQFSHAPLTSRIKPSTPLFLSLQSAYFSTIFESNVFHPPLMYDSYLKFCNLRWIFSSLTFEKVRRLLEKDLGLETHALDAHKRFVKQWLHTVFYYLSASFFPLFFIFEFPFLSHN